MLLSRAVVRAAAFCKAARGKGPQVVPAETGAELSLAQCRRGPGDPVHPWFKY